MATRGGVALTGTAQVEGEANRRPILVFFASAAVLTAAFFVARRSLLPVYFTTVGMMATSKGLSTTIFDALLPMRFLPCRRLFGGCTAEFMAAGGLRRRCPSVRRGDGTHSACRRGKGTPDDGVVVGGKRRGDRESAGALVCRAAVD